MFRRPRTRYFNRNLVSHPTLSCSTSEHAHWNLSIRCKKKHGNSLRSHPIHRIVSNRYAMPPPSSITVTDLSIETRFSLQFTRSSGRATGFGCIVRTSSAPTASSTWSTRCCWRIVTWGWPEQRPPPAWHRIWSWSWWPSGCFKDVPLR